MSSWKYQEVEKALTKKGFSVQRVKKHKHYVLMYNNKMTSVKTVISHGKGEISRQNPLFRQIKQQLCLETNSELENLLNCPLSESDYKKLLRERKHIKD